jgi:hypothetical protein
MPQDAERLVLAAAIIAGEGVQIGGEQMANRLLFQATQRELFLT